MKFNRIEIQLKEDEIAEIFNEIREDGFMMLMCSANIYTTQIGLGVIQRIYDHIEKINGVRN